MTDRELLELAAKAAGNPQGTSRSGGGLLMANDLYWNPLTDDGDALRLAVMLNLTVYHWPDEVCVCDEKGTVNEDLARLGDLYAATRRAIVRAAAEIGKGMK
jgi:hypothetical protein